MGTPHYPKTIGDAVTALRRQAAAAYTSSNTRKALVKIQAQILDLFGELIIRAGGTLLAQYANSATALQVGPMTLSDGTPVHGFLIQRPGGQKAFWTYGEDAGASGFWGLYDLNGDYIITDDAYSGRGIARPYIPLQVGDYSSAPAATTTNASFEDVLLGVCPIQQPVLYAYLLVRSSDGSTTGEVRLALDGTAIGPTITVNAGDFIAKNVGPFAVPDPGTYANLRTLTVQARRTAGTGTIGVRALTLIGLESSWV